MVLLLLKKLSFFSNSVFKLSSNIIMNSNNNQNCSRLAVLAQQLRQYKPPVVPFQSGLDDDNNEGVSNSQLGFPQSNNNLNLNINNKNRNRAAVLICLFQGKSTDNNDDDLRVILTKRSSGLSTHSGEVSLPGGKAEEDDVDDADTATREAKEEIGLDPSLVNVVTVLEPFLSKHLLRVTPVIGILSDRDAFNPIPNTDEVDDVFDAPLEMFLKDENRKSEERELMGNRILIHSFDYEIGGKKYLIWGLTAGILIRTASIVYQRSPAFLEQNPNIKLPGVLKKDTKM
ncbi:nudix hydrolase 15, mitochondrial-like [Rutidosis leptorrhynchoides]|uniref:nudix hydrolase 15, mitochondrial-like n=1 Tax=Rutidosis leptorrhynchoides TaxID=125765 RepID=UPI003A992003